MFAFIAKDVKTTVKLTLYSLEVPEDFVGGPFPKDAMYYLTRNLESNEYFLKPVAKGKAAPKAKAQKAKAKTKAPSAVPEKMKHMYN